ncbi:Asa1p KNAG_0A07390 [Huiozyma naganishii CBS 8797]|uniref:Uncharacterized protein n=1 Tax=Huiozyma naganishii (strain ATCC MYA-139 / BCRC 22969 / CBS 8797 / KCTC 17520 / NBRC 10181 / NCYC 3082 / Yp74L-3) TaxID=1071383 RepID=J7RU91_HUIN7|nr:hypothetical protein KNAG_0A07390 [Kazachstania naganishii CBS 8797]CCK68392.1 hypothetical protein KNAG_0A07390 [Kazachstania naganishii CBS 8797]
MDDTKLPDYTLRAHTCAVTTVLVVDDCHTPTLVSTDEKGRIIVWDLITRRSVRSHQLESGAAITATQYVEPNLLACLSKEDCSLRLYNLATLEEIFEMKVNTMSFANFVIARSENGLLTLFCCSTTNPEAIDCYTIDVTTKRLKRVAKELHFGESIANVLPDGLPKIDKLGLVMKFISHDSGTMFIGFESGIIIGFRLVFDSISDGDCLVVVTHVSAPHCPRPILSLEIDVNNRAKLLGSSTDTIIATDTIITTDTCAVSDMKSRAGITTSNDLAFITSEIHDTHTRKIYDIKSLSKYLLWSTWTGKSYSSKVDTSFIEKYWKSKSSLIPIESSQGSFDKNKADPKVSRYVKTKCITGFDSHCYSCRFGVRMDSVALSDRSKERRLLQFAEHSWYIIGYEDGSISLYRLK